MYYILIRLVLVPSLIVAYGCGVALQNSFRVKAPLKDRLFLGTIGATGIGLSLFAVIKIYVLSYWE